MQECFESTYLVNNFLLQAFDRGLDITNLLKSEIIQTRLNSDILEHWDLWP